VLQEKASPPNRAFWLIVVLLTVYQSYRYPLQINSSGTSPTYSDTPVILQAGKFVLAIPFIAIFLTQCGVQRMRLSYWLAASAALFLFGFSVLKIVNQSDPGYIDASFWLLFSLVAAMSVKSVSIGQIERYFKFLLFYSFASSILEVALFITIGRLPALAYATGLSVRFGAFLDDPNGFAPFCFLMLGWSLYRYRGWLRASLIFGLFVLLLLTQSWTAIIFFMGFLLLWSFRATFRWPVFSFPLLCLLVLAVGLVVSRFGNSLGALLWELVSTKQQSAQEHVVPLSEWVLTWSRWVLLGTSKYEPFESWWAAAAINFGLIWACVDFLVVGALVFAIQRAHSAAGRQTCPTYAGLLFFAVYFFIGSFNLPYPSIFPANVLFFTFSFLVLFGKIDDRCDPALQPSPVRRWSAA
jgi:hypothetical protein